MLPKDAAADLDVRYTEKYMCLRFGLMIRKVIFYRLCGFMIIHRNLTNGAADSSDHLVFRSLQAPIRFATAGNGCRS